MPWDARMTYPNRVGVHRPEIQGHVEAQAVDGPAEVREGVACMLEGAALPLFDAIVHERVVHVIPDGPDRSQVERSVDVNAACRAGDGDRKLAHTGRYGR